MDKIFKLNKGDIIYVDLGHHSDSSVQSGKRPCVVVSCDTDNNINGNPIVNVCPCATKYEKKKRRTHVLLREDDVEGYLMKASLILVEQLVPVDKKMIVGKTGRIISRDVMDRIDKAIQYRFALI